LKAAEQTTAVPAFGITGTGGAGKSSTDELIRRIRLDQDDQLNIALISSTLHAANPAVLCSVTASV
jgi:methylmalonyl-CoA mutase